LTNPDLNVSRDFSSPFISPLPDWVVSGKQFISEHSPWGKLSFLLTPGHTPGSVCLFLPVVKLAFSGDTLLPGQWEELTFPGGDRFAISSPSLEEIF